MRRFVAFIGALVMLGALLHAQVPQLVNYQGRVAVGTTNFNSPPNGVFKFALVNATGTTTFWSNDGTSAAGSQPTAAVSLTVTKGLYSVLLGDTTVPGMTLAIPASVWTNPDVRLRVWFNDGTNGSQLLTPDQRLAPTGYLPDGSVSSAKLASGLTLGGTTTGTFSGNLNLPTTTGLTVGAITQSGTSLLHTFGIGNFFAGANAGNFTMTGHSNTAVGSSSLRVNMVGTENTAVGSEALVRSTGVGNTAVGNHALQYLQDGSDNIAVGNYAGAATKKGSNNIYIGDFAPVGDVEESGKIRIGTTGTHTDTYLTGVIHGATTRLGSGTGTTEPPDKPLIIRRAKSTNSTAGQVVARTDNLTLERDGSIGGWRISYVAFAGPTTIAFTGLTAAGAAVNFVTSPNPVAAGTVTVFTNAQALISIRGTFGDSYSPGEQTEVSLSRYPGDYLWTGTLTSTFNQ